MTTCPYNPPPNNIESRYKPICKQVSQELYKGNILQYKMNSSLITQNMKYSQIAKGIWANRTTTWASQTDQNTNPNTKNLKRVNYTGVIPVCPPTPSSIFSNLPSIPSEINPKPPPVIPPLPPVPPIVGPVLPPSTPVDPGPVPEPAAEGGTLLCNTTVDPCTGETIFITTPQDCFSSDCSDIPGPIIYLCYNSTMPSYYPRVVRTYRQV
jgi:hypothetical protein